jgi:hypothetical protein
MDVRDRDGRPEASRGQAEGGRDLGQAVRHPCRSPGVQ